LQHFGQVELTLLMIYSSPTRPKIFKSKNFINVESSLTSKHPISFSTVSCAHRLSNTKATIAEFVESIFLSTLAAHKTLIIIVFGSTFLSVTKITDPSSSPL
jgi:hypothetical protein